MYLPKRQIIKTIVIFGILFSILTIVKSCNNQSDYEYEYNKQNLSIVNTSYYISTEPIYIESEEEELNNIIKEIDVNYESYGVPNLVDSSFKTYMDYRCCGKNTKQRKLYNELSYIDNNGFVRCDGEEDLGIIDDYYFIALGSYYGTNIGDKYKITTDNGNIIYGILGDAKADQHTNSTHQYAVNNNDVVEFLVHTPNLRKDVKQMGNANVYEPLSGNIVKIEKIIFNYGN